ncbi:MAG: hypothetical protein ABH857_02890 [Elusimicrobiota bacterium]
MRKILFFVVLVLFYLTGSLFAQRDPGVYGSMGTAVLTDEQGNRRLYNQLSIQPEFTLGKIGIGLNLVLYFDEEGNLRESDWNDWSDIPEKILYIKYGEKRDPVYVYIGGTFGMTLGHGIIFDDYSNMLQYPDVKNIALAFDLDFGMTGFETITTNIKRLEVVGGRAYYRPLYNSDMPLLSKLAIGVSAGMDVDPDNDETTKNDKVAVVGADVDVPVIETDALSVITYFDIAQMDLGSVYTNAGSKNNGMGYAPGVMGKFLIFNYRAEYRRLQNNFYYGYFDVFYEVNRSSKPWSISSAEEPWREGPYFELGYNLLGKIDVMASYEDISPDTYQENPKIHAELSIDKSLFLNKMFLNFTYDKKNAETWDDVMSLEGPNTIMVTELGYSMGGNLMLVITEKKTFDAFGKSLKTTTMEMRFQF